MTRTADSDLDDAPCGLLQTLEDGTIRRANRTFAEWLGTNKHELVGRRLQDLLTMGGKIFHYTHWAPLLRMQGSVSEVKLELGHPAGPIPMVLNAIRREQAGTVVVDIAAYVARDRDRYEKELVQARHRLEAAVAELDTLHRAERERAAFAEQMMGIVSHDLRNPLGAVLMGIDLLATPQATDAQQRVIARIRSATNRASDLIDDLLDFTSARAGRGIAVSLAEIALHDVIAEGLDELRLAHPSRAIVHQRSGERTCIGDARRLVQLVGNLVSNAFVYGAPDAPVTVATGIGDASWITVHNLGPAIPSALQAQLFEPMTRGQASGASRSVGLGLFIVREIARAHGGSASVTSGDGGSTFRVEWPTKRTTRTPDVLP